MMKFWNYSKTPSRGVKEVEIYLDDVLIYRGALLPSPGQNDLDDALEGEVVCSIVNWIMYWVMLVMI